LGPSTANFRWEPPPRLGKPNCRQRHSCLFPLRKWVASLKARRPTELGAHTARTRPLRFASATQIVGVRAPSSIEGTHPHTEPGYAEGKLENTVAHGLSRLEQFTATINPCPAVCDIFAPPAAPKPAPTNAPRPGTLPHLHPFHRSGGPQVRTSIAGRSHRLRPSARGSSRICKSSPSVEAVRGGRRPLMGQRVHRFVVP
jgi:hypothetical protein